jgi:hypothetical protein
MEPIVQYRSVACNILYLYRKIVFKNSDLLCMYAHTLYFSLILRRISRADASGYLVEGSVINAAALLLGDD